MRSFIVLVFGTLSMSACSQKVKPCGGLEFFLNSEQVQTAFHLGEKADTLLLADRQNEFAKKCELLKWRNKNVTIIFDTAINRKMSKAEFHHFFKDSSNQNLYVIYDFSRRGKVYNFTVVHPHTNFLVRGKVKITRQNISF